VVVISMDGRSLDENAYIVCPSTILIIFLNTTPTFQRFSGQILVCVGCNTQETTTQSTHNLDIYKEGISQGIPQ